MNGAYALKGKNVLKAESLVAKDGPAPRQLAVTTEHFNVLPDAIPTFDHFTPAEWLIQNPAILEEENEEVATTLARFDAIFAWVNALLPQE